MPGPLNGYRIVDLTSNVSGPLATMILADQGADVIKVEAPNGGDSTRSGANRRGGFRRTRGRGLPVGRTTTQSCHEGERANCLMVFRAVSLRFRSPLRTIPWLLRLVLREVEAAIPGSSACMAGQAGSFSLGE